MLEATRPNSLNIWHQEVFYSMPVNGDIIVNLQEWSFVWNSDNTRQLIEVFNAKGYVPVCFEGVYGQEHIQVANELLDISTKPNSISFTPKIK